ncbi:hypothetical protein [Streptomyces sp. NPDC002845]
MPHTPDRPDRREGDHQEGRFADLFARKARTPLRGFLPGRRVWKAVGGSAAAVLVIAGSATVVSAIDWSGGDSDTVTTAADEEATEEKPASGDDEQPSAGPSPEEDGDKPAPEVVYVPVSGGAGAGAAQSGGSGQSAQEQSAAKSDSADATGGTTGTSGGTGTTGTTTGGKEGQSSSTPFQDTQSQPATDYLWADGNVDPDSNDYWDQSSITVKSTTALTEFKVVLRVIQTGGVQHTGFWSSLGDKVNVAQAADSTQLAYVVTLKTGVTLDPGTYVLQFQYNHDQGRRDAGRDRYNVNATSADSVSETRNGGF